LFFNKYVYWSQKFIENYISSFSTEFLFLKGDPNLRHHLNQNSIGQFYPIELFILIIGLSYVMSNLSKSNLFKFLIGLLIISPIPSAMTRDGGNHAPRLFYLFIPLSILICLGLFLIKKRKWLFNLTVLSICLYFVSSSYYLYTVFRLESASAFNYGFLESAQIALTNKSKYQNIIIDAGNESGLMAYLFVSQFPPRLLQKSFPLPAKTISQGIEGYIFDNIIILYPGTRDWTKIKLPGQNLLITSILQPNSNLLKQKMNISYPDKTPAIIVSEL